jgi:di/tricarboxylate transporter
MIGTSAAVLEAAGYRIWGLFEISYWGIPAKIITLIMVYFLANRVLLKGFPFKEPDAAAAAEAKELPNKFTFKMGLTAAILVATLLGFIINNPKVPPNVCATLGALACLFTGCLTPKEMYKAVNWDIIMLIGGMSAFARGLETSGVGKVIADTILGFTGVGASPILIIFIILITTGIITQFMSDNAAVALMGPIAITLAVAQGVNVHAYMMAALIGSMLCHLSIMATPSAAFALGLGGYNNKYLLKNALLFELPINLLVSMVMIPLVYL